MSNQLPDQSDVLRRLIGLRRENAAMQSRCLDILEEEWARVKSVAGPLPAWTAAFDEERS